MAEIMERIGLEPARPGHGWKSKAVRLLSAAVVSGSLAGCYYPAYNPGGGYDAAYTGPVAYDAYPYGVGIFGVGWGWGPGWYGPWGWRGGYWGWGWGGWHGGWGYWHGGWGGWHGGWRGGYGGFRGGYGFHDGGYRGGGGFHGGGDRGHNH